ncbi:maestro heat-like repeat-containing protein family member 1 [Leucoraja erinacea]|uniref:maestro heat-like repeat-containing protein family member 1 n=1 Tax=Leucoraja erinaceus TaxID=7782 RepID=UPI002458F6A4|nr:maestro heat-like repeat-containing protein family member 1 [Leucoraja erinacea]
MYSSAKSFSVALLKMTEEEDEICQQKISNTLHTLGCHHPEIVLTACHDYLSHRSIHTASQGIVVLEIITRIIKDTLDQISQATAEQVISSAVLWVTMSGTKAEIQEVASNLLAAMSFRFINEIVQLMMVNFKHGHLPHIYMVKTLTKMSTENVYGMVPFLKAILNTMIPVIIKVREDEMKSVFASAIGSFSQSILNYLGNSEKGLDPTITRKSFFTEISVIYSLLFQVWLEKEPSKFNIPTVEALGYVSNLLPKDKLDEELPKLILGILTLYEKQVGHFSITECLCRVLESATEMRCVGLKTLMDNLLNSLHQQICLSVDLNKQLPTRSQIAILSCFTVLASTYTDSVFNFLLGKLENSDQRMRAGTLYVLRHLISSSSSHLEGQKTQIMAAIKPVILDTSSNMEKKHVAQVICAMAQQGYLEPEGGEVMVEFLIEQCNIPTDSRTTAVYSHQLDQVTNEDLVSICETVTFIITDIMKMEAVLWPFLLGCVTKTQYTKALTTICNCLTHIAKRKLQTSGERFLPIYDENLPKAQALLARLFLTSCCPYQGGSRGAAALRLLQALSFSIHPAIVSDWEEQLPSLTDYLLDNSEVSLPQQEWEEKLLLFLSRTLNAIDDEEWTSTLSDEMCKQIDTNYCGPQEKAFFYKSLGTVLHQMPSKNIKKELHQMLQNVQHSESAERESVAIAFGLCAMTHFDDTLGTLEEFAQSSRFKNMNSFFNILRDKSDVNGDKAKSTLVLCYGNMALYAPEELALSRIETHILPAVINQFNPCRQGIKPESKDLTLKLSLIKTVTLIARSLLSSHQMVPFNFSRKGELLRFMQQLIEAEPPDLLHGPVRQLAMKACTYLVQLHSDSKLTDTSRLVQTCVMSVFSLGSSELQKNEINGNTKEPPTLFVQTMAALQELLKQILLQDMSSEGFQAIFIQLEHWIMSRKDYERERAMATTLELLKYYLEALYFKNVMPLNNLGTLIGQLMPRSADPSVAVGQLAVESLYIILTIQLLYESANLDQHNRDLEVLKAVQDQLVNRDSSIFFQTCCQITEVISKCLPHDQLANLVFALFKGLADQHPCCSSAAAIFMKAIIERRGSELWDQVSEIFSVLRVPLMCTPYKMVKLSVLRSIAILASHNTATVVSYLLTYNITSDEYFSAIWRSLAEERQCALLTITELLDTLNKQLCSGVKGAHSTSGSLPQPSALESLAPMYALYEMIITPESQETVNNLFPQLFSTLLVHHCSSVNVRLPKIFVPHNDSKQRELSAEPETSSSRNMCENCVNMLIKLLNLSHNEQVVHFMVESGGWEQMMDLRKSHRGVMLLAKAMVQCAIPGLPVIVAQLAAFILTVQDCQKVTVAAFFGEVLKSPLAVQMQLTEILMNRLLRCLLNTSAVVQFLCVRGLGNITSGAPYSIEKYSRPVLCAMISLIALGENDNEVLMFEVLLCLSRYLEQLRANTIRPFILKIFTGIQPFFEAKSDKVRAEAFWLLGKLAKCASRDPQSYLYRQFHSNFVCLLLHLNGNSKEVSSACNSTLRLVIPLLGSAEVFSKLEQQLREPVLDYTEFLRDISKQLIKDFPDRVHSYVTDCTSFFNNPKEQIRANAVTLSAFFFQHIEVHSKPAQRATWWNKYKHSI